MGLLDNLLRRFGYVKIARYGLTVAPNGNIVPIAALALPPPAPMGWRAQTGDAMPLPAPDWTREAWAPPAPQPFVQPSVQPFAQPFVQPTPPAPRAAVSPPPLPQPAQAEQTDGEGDWEWKLAMARAKAREDETQVIPKAGQIATMQPTAPPPAAPPRQRLARATTPPQAPFRARPLGARSNYRPSRLPGVGGRPSDRPLARPALASPTGLGEDTQVDTKRAPAASGGALPRFTDRFAVG